MRRGGAREAREGAAVGGAGGGGRRGDRTRGLGRAVMSRCLALERAAHSWPLGQWQHPW